MARYLSAAWVASFDAALQALDLTEVLAAAGQSSLAAADGSFSVVQVVTGVPRQVVLDGGAEQAAGDEDRVRVVLTVSDGGVRLRLDPDGTAVPAGTATIVLGYPEALALARGDLDPADALAAGKVRVRGDLAALVAGQAVLAGAAALLGDALEDLTDVGPDTPA